MLRTIAGWLGVFLVSGVWASAALAAARCDPPVATLTSAQGTVEWQAAGGTGWEPLQRGDGLCPGDTIRAGERSRADVRLLDQSVMRIRAGTRMTLEGLRSDDSYVIDLLEGASHFFSRKGDLDLEVDTPFTVAGVRGTEFLVEVDADRTLVVVYEGRVQASNGFGGLALADGQSAVASAGRPPTPHVVARPRDAVHWALYYVPVLYLSPDERRADTGWRQSVARANERYLQGDLRGAFESLEGVAAADVSDARFFGYRASLLLAVGDVDAAMQDIDRALALAPNDSDALALRAIVAIAHNDPEGALDAATRAVATNPDSATAKIALSYVQQSRFDLEAARTSLEEAVALAPRNALAWARLAEIQSSFGDLDDAMESAATAAALEPDLSRTQTVLGFAYLTRVDTERARSAFERAIALDQADPLPHLGLGLARIRGGDLHEGGREIEVAASLDPNSSTTRSYLGKTYYEEKRTGLDVREFEIAKQLDPNDPTPWFYDAIAKQTTNRPVQALHDLQRSIELNDGRAVYRSRLLLDSDLASRSASQGRVYSDLDFQNLALVEGWKSVNTDPTNYSAHRLLADSYAARPRHEIARVSELLQSQLLQPTNITPIQPRLGESNLFLVSAQGPASLSFEEFNPLFNRNRAVVQGSGLFGEDDTWSGEGIVSAIYDKASVSGGFTYFNTDGFRANNELEDQIGTAFAQYQLTPETSIQAEYRRRQRDTGDLELRFFDDDFSRYFDAEVESDTVRGAVRHAFSPGSVLLASYIYQNKNIDERDFSPGNPVAPFPPPPDFGPDLSLRSETDEVAHSGEGQYLFRSGPDPFGESIPVRNVNVVAGGGYFHIDRKVRNTLAFSETTILNFPFCGVFPNFFICDQTFPGASDTDVARPDVEHVNFYVYSYVTLPEDARVTLGISGDFVDVDGVDDKDRINPKVGFEWSPSFVPGMTVRASAFRMLKRTLITDQTLEPTQVAGFNQFFDDVNGTYGWRYGGAIDQKFTESIFGGVEYSQRELEVPGVFAGLSQAGFEADWDEKLARTYLFWTPCDWLALRAEYEWERFDRDPFVNGVFFAFKEVETHRVPFGFRLFHPIGLSAGVGATWLHQKGNFYREDQPVCSPPGSPLCLDRGSRDFWVLDAALGYRLPRRYGFVTFGVNNFLDEDSTYQATDVRNPSIRPERFIYGSVTLSFP